MIWPFASRVDGPNPGAEGSGQWRRIDQGQDLQAVVGTPVLAIADGIISYAHDPHGFGDPYPVLHFDVPVDGNPACYYGHNHSEVREGAHVAQGDVIAHASPTPGGNASALPGWLELGWWSNGPTGNGASMHAHLLAAAPFAQGDQDMPLTQAEKDAVAQETANAVHQLLEEFWNNQFSPALTAIKADVDAVKAKLGA